MKKRLLLLSLVCFSVLGAFAQRFTDVLDRGLVAVKTGSAVFCSWRINADEYYDVAYNVYRDGTKLNAEPLTVSNYYDASGTTSSTYTVEPVVRGVAKEQCKPVSVWSSNYKELKMDHGSLTSTYVPNDACCADVDGDGEVEILIKFDNQSDGYSGFQKNGYNGEYAIMEVYKLDGTKLWWIELGPNMTDFQNNENNIVAYDWDQDGKAEALLRAMDGTIIHKADGTTFSVGDPSKNYRPSGGMSGQFFTHHLGPEYLLYLNGATGDVYQCIDYPLPTLESGETDVEAAWGDGYGHRASKYFFGAPYLDGRNPSIFLARGIYTQHKMVAYDVNPATHELKLRWRWTSKNKSGSWFGQGYHNYCIGDVDWDGRDEIVFGSMVIDDNGNGLSTSGLGHGDALHLSDFDPYSWGQEFFACNESQPSNNFRNATTSEIYYRHIAGNDDGRGMMGNFIDAVPGCEGTSARDGGLISSVTHKHTTAHSGAWHIAQNFRIYWDGDLCEESFNYSNGKNTEGAIYDGVTGLIATLSGSMTNNDTKGTPSYQGDILGDWREEVIMRTSNNNIRIYTTNQKTSWRIPSLWYDHQYRQAMVWQMCGYNQPPHASFFLGQLEGITEAPAPLTMTGRTAIANGGTIDASADDKHVILCETNDMAVTVAAGAKPYMVTVNAPSWTQGHGNNTNITTEKFTHKLTGAPFTGSMRLVKQGEGILELPAGVHTYTGETKVWGGTLKTDATLQNSPLWLNRFTRLESNGGKFLKGIEAEYETTIVLGGEGNKGTIETDALVLDFGSRIIFDLYAADITADVIKAKTLKLQACTWVEGPKYTSPVFQFVLHKSEDAASTPAGKYLIGEVESVDGSLSGVKIEGLSSMKTTLQHEDGKLYLVIETYVPMSITWSGSQGVNWDLDNTTNFITATGEARVFVPGDSVTFDDNSQTSTINVVGTIAPGAITFNNDTKQFVLKGDSLVGDGALVKNGNAQVSVQNLNRVGSTTINGGTLTVTALANNVGQDCGSLGTTSKTITINDGATLGINGTVTTTQPIRIGEGTATFNVNSGQTFTVNSSIRRTGNNAVLVKKGSGTLNLGSGNTITRLVIAAGVVNNAESNSVAQLPATVEFQGGTLYDTNSFGSYSNNNANFYVPEGKTGTFYTDPRCTYNGSLTGSGTFKVYAAGIRTYFKGDWSKFEGTIVPGLSKRGSYDPVFDYQSTTGMGKATLQLDAGFTFDNAGKTIALGGVKGTGTLAGTGTYVLGGLGNNFTFNVTCTSRVNKKGTGTMTLITPGKLSAALTVQEGTLALGTLNSSKMIGNNMLTVSGTSVLVGKAYLHALNINGNASVKLHDRTVDTKPTTIKLSNNFSSTGNAITHFYISSTANSTLEVGGSITPGHITVALVDGYTPKVGDSFTLWTAASITAEMAGCSLPALPEGLYWDKRGLAEATGVLKVTDDAALGIDGVQTNAGEANYAVYTLGGVKLGDVRATEDGLVDEIKTLGVQPGTYVVRAAGTTRKVVVK